MPAVVSDLTLVELGGERQFLVIRAKDMCQERLFKKKLFSLFTEASKFALLADICSIC